MEQEERFPVCLVEADRSGDIVPPQKYSLLRKAIGIVMCAQLMALATETPIVERVRQETFEAIHIDFDTAETTTTTVPPTTSTTQKTKPTTTTTQPTTTTTVAETTTTTATTVPAPVSTTTTTLSLEEQCPEIVEEIEEEYPLADGWTVTCGPPSKWVDGMADPVSKKVTIHAGNSKKTGDQHDTRETVESAYIHERTHTFQEKHDLWNAATQLGYWVPDSHGGNGYCQSLEKKPITKDEKLAVLEHQTHNPIFYCAEDLEKQADDIAFALGYYHDNVRGTPQGAAAACQTFRERGENLC